MISPEMGARYSPEQEELEDLFVSIRDSLLSNPRLSVGVETKQASHIVREFRRHRFSGIEASTVLQEPEQDPDYVNDTIIVESRRAPDDPIHDMDWVSVTIFNHKDYQTPHRHTRYFIQRDLSTSVNPQSSFSYFILKTLPTLDAHDSQYGRIDRPSDEEDKFADFVDDEVRAITPEDIQLLQRLAASLSQ